MAEIRVDLHVRLEVREEGWWERGGMETVRVDALMCQEA